ncbi:MAG: RNA polymerase subunit sigma [Thermoanaerobaculia bacterium]|nr:RNA polymerase subunit sigma [Thermoanaerobaculia bacterium]
MYERSVEELSKSIREVGQGHLVVVTGAGISAASGIPTFRGDDPDAIWKKDVTEMATYRFFREDPVASWRWYLHRFDLLPSAQPNDAHRALVDLQQLHSERGGRFTLVTQNIDTLHERAGSEDLVKVHGSIDRLRCGARGGCPQGSPKGSISRDEVAEATAAFRADPSETTLPPCPDCSDILRPHVLWFDEYYADHDDYQWPRVQNAARTADFLLFIGTSFSVGVTELFLQSSMVQKIPAWSIDPSPVPSYYPVDVVRAKAEDVLPSVVDRLCHKET